MAVAQEKERCENLVASPIQYDAGVEVIWDNAQALTNIPSIHAGETVALKVDGAVNINREIYEDRKCGFMGISCWYEKKVRNNFVKANTQPLRYWSVKAGDTTAPQNERRLSEVNKVETLQDADLPRKEQPRDSIAIKAMIGDSQSILRLGCQGEPKTCSAGAYTLSISIDSAPRAQLLRKALSSKPYTYAELMDEQIQNRNLRQSANHVKSCFAEALFKQAVLFHGPGAGSSSQERQKILQAALQYDGENNEIKTALAQTFIDTGQYAQARATSNETVGNYEKLIKAGSTETSVFEGAAKNYAALAEISWRETAGNSTRGAVEAVASLRLALDRLSQRLERSAFDNGADDARKLTVDYSLRLAQILGRMGTEDKIDDAVSTLKETLRRIPVETVGIPLEASVVGGETTTVNPFGPIVINRNWTEARISVPTPSTWTLVPFDRDPGASEAELIVHSRGEEFDVRRVSDFIEAGSATNIVLPDRSCHIEAALLGGEQVASLVRDSTSSAEKPRSSLVLSGIDSPVKGVERELTQLTISRRHGQLPSAVAYLSSEVSGDIPQFEVYRHQLITSTRVDAIEAAVALSKAVEAKSAVLRADPTGRVFALGTSDRAQGPYKWSLIRSRADDKNAFVSTKLSCGTNDAMDDLLIAERSETAVHVLGIGPSCLAASELPVAAPAGGQEAVALKPLEGLEDRFLNVASARRSKILWANADGTSIAVRADADETPTRLVIVRPSDAAEIFETELAEIDPGLGNEHSARAICGEAKGVQAEPATRFRVVDVTFKSDSDGNDPAAPATVFPVVRIVHGGVLGSLVMEAIVRDEARPSGAADGADAVLRSGQMSGRSALVNSSDYFDFQLDPSGRIWALRASGNEIVPLGRESSLPDDSAFKPVSLPQAEVGTRLTYLIDSASQRMNLQVLEENEDGEPTRFVVVDPSTSLPGTCPLIGPDGETGTFTGICTSDELAQFAGVSAGATLAALWENPSPSATYRRPKALLFSEKQPDGSFTVRVVTLPVRRDSQAVGYHLPPNAEPRALLGEAQGSPVLVYSRGTDWAAASADSTEIGTAVTVAEIAGDKTRVLTFGSRLLVMSPSADNPIRPVQAYALLEMKNGTLRKVDCKDCPMPNVAMVGNLKTSLFPHASLRYGMAGIAVDPRLERILVVGDKASVPWVKVKLGEAASIQPVSNIRYGLPFFLTNDKVLVSYKREVLERWGIDP
ncbi:tetratricopeptide repeat protein [Rhizobium sp. R339]|uniref:tetratricopeptide repeat protein n=1 Tax=Rhizobium sp. R339 TaxID=1764273 RepID=UPI00113021CD|nr:tetratricopeptide repeat protein [Rhizobium sp. R339]